MKRRHDHKKRLELSTQFRYVLLIVCCLAVLVYLSTTARNERQAGLFLGAAMTGAEPLKQQPQSASLFTLPGIGLGGTQQGSGEPGLKPPLIVGRRTASILGHPVNTNYRALDFVNANVGFVAVWSPDALLFTANGGATWTTMEEHGLTIVRMSFVTPKLGYALARMGHGKASYSQLSVVRTTDGGIHWTVLTKVPWAQASASPYVHFFAARQGVVLVGNVCLTTTNGGQTWRRIHFGVPEFVPTAIAFADARDGLAAGIQGGAAAQPPTGGQQKSLVLRTTDGGMHWSVVWTRASSYVPSAVVAQSAASGWLVVRNTSAQQAQLYHTGDGGRTWQCLQPNLLRTATPNGIGEPAFVSANVGWIADAAGTQATRSGIGITRDGGRSFQLIGANRGWRMSAVDPVTPTVGYALGNSVNSTGFVLRSTNGGRTFAQILPALQPSGNVSFLNSAVAFGIGLPSDPYAVLQTTDGGNSWRMVGSAPGVNQLYATFVFANANDGWMVGQRTMGSPNLRILRTQNGGVTWSFSGVVGNVAADAYPGYLKFFDSPQGDSLTGIMDRNTGVGDKLFVTGDGGVTWREQSDALIGPATAADSFVTPLRGYLGSTVQLYQYPGRRSHNTVVLRSTVDGGVHWTRLFTEANTVSQIARVDFTSYSRGSVLLYTQAPDGTLLPSLLVTDTAGKTWTDFSLPDAATLQMPTAMSGARLDFADNATGFILTADGLLKTVDGGVVWTWLP